MQITPSFEGAYNKDILQSLKTIFAISEGEVCGDRSFGIRRDILEEPVPLAINDFVICAAEQIERYEPRVQLVDVDWSGSDYQNGILRPLVKVALNADYDGDLEAVEDDGQMYDFWSTEGEE